MKTLIIILSIFTIQTITYSQSIVDTSKLWNNLITYYYTWSYGTETIKFTTDTIINGLQYKKVSRSLEEFPGIWSFYGFIREDANNKVFYRLNGSEPEKIIYNFNVNLYDTINVYGLQNYENKEFLNMDYYVSSIDSILVGNSYRKQYHMLTINGSGINNWIEGLGGTDGILRNWNGWVGMDGYILLCYKEYDTLKYIDSTYNTCYLVTGVTDNEPQKKIVNIIPNPIINTSKFEIISNSNSEDIEVNFYNSIGQRIMKKSGSKEFFLNKKDFNSGLFYYCVSDGLKIIGSGKIVIN